jgi:tRNA A-37 threonylcarbamoyl transferase component Bud32
LKRLEQNGIRWFIDGSVDLSSIIGELTEETGKRRSYGFREHEGHRVFVKYFLEKGLVGSVRNRFSPRGKREFLLGNRLLSLSIPTPCPLGYGVGRHGSFVLQQYLSGVTFKAAFDTSSVSSRHRLLGDLACLLKRLRDCGVNHNDLHLENILVVGGDLYLIDLHKSVIRNGTLSKAVELVNLSHGLTMIYDCMTEREKRRLFDDYGNAAIRSELETRLYRQWRKWIERKKGRAFADTSKLKVEGRRVYVRGEEGRGRKRLETVLKLDKKIRVERHADHLRKIYIHGRRLRKAWENFVVLLYLDLPVVPKPYFVERGPLLEAGFVAMEDLGSRGEELDRFLDRHYDSMGRSHRRHLAQQIADFLGGLLKKGVIHRDLKACNLFVTEGRFLLLDVEDFAFYHAEMNDIIRLLLQLNTSVPGRIESRDRVSFLCRLARYVPFDRTAALKQVREKSRKVEVIYEGVSGLKKEMPTVN